MMAPLDESYRARWFLSCKSCHPALAAPVGQIPLGKSRWAKYARWSQRLSPPRPSLSFPRMPFKKHLNNCGARLRGAQSAAAPVSWGPISPDPQPQSTRAISALEPQYAAEPQPRNAKAASAPDIKAPSPFQLLEPKAHKPKTISPNHRGKTRSSSAFSRRHFGGWQPRFRLRRIQQLPLHQAPEAYRQAPTQAPSRE